MSHPSHLKLLKGNYLNKSTPTSKNNNCHHISRCEVKNTDDSIPTCFLLKLNDKDRMFVILIKKTLNSVSEEVVYFHTKKVPDWQNHTHLLGNIKISPPTKHFVTYSVDGIHQDGM